MAARYTESSRTSQGARVRVTRACDNCRRKKSRCPGQTPECSLCMRLGQRCTYSHGRRLLDSSIHEHWGHERAFTTVESRFEEIENKLERLTAAMSYAYPRGHDIGSSSITRQRTEVPDPSSLTMSSSSHADMPQHIALAVIKCYFEHFECRPCPLLYGVAETHLPAPEEMSPVVLYAMTALCLPICRHACASSVSSISKLSDLSSESAWAILCSAYSEFQFDTSYFQGLCLLAQADFSSAKYDRAQTQVALGLKLAQLQGLLEPNPDMNAIQSPSTAQMGIVWTLFMLDKITGTGCEVKSHLSSAPCAFRLPIHQGGPVGPHGRSEAPQSFVLGDTAPASPWSPFGSITAVMIELLDIWGDITSTILQKKPRDEKPFWWDNSSRARIQTRMLEFELKMGFHTYNATGSPFRVYQEPHLKNYYSARFFLHILHTGALCCINHPFIIFVGTERSSGHVPWSFLQNSYKISTVNANWIARLVTEMEKTGLSLQDPFIGYLVTIAATIHLEKSLNSNSDVANPAQQRYDTCYRFVKNLSHTWPTMSNAANTLEDLSARLRSRSTLAFTEDEYDGMVQPNHTRDVKLSDNDVRLMWRVFHHATVSRPQHSEQESQDPMGASQFARTPEGYVQNSQIDDMEVPSTPDFAMYDDDWLLFGQPWAAYFPSDIVS